MPDLLVIINDAGAIESINDSAAAVFGYTATELHGTGSQTILEIPDRPSVVQPCTVADGFDSSRCPTRPVSAALYDTERQFFCDDGRTK